MSYWVSLYNETGQIVEVEPFEEGGTYVLGGSDEAELNITYNYTKCYAPFGFHLTDLDNKMASETIPKLEELVEKLGTEQDDDYWKPTNGNAGFALSILLKWAKQYPEARWEVQ